MIYTKEYLIDAFLYRYCQVLIDFNRERLDAFVEMIEAYYDEVGKEKFRVYASLDAEALKKFKLAIQS